MAVETAKKQGSIKPRRMKAPKPFKKRIEPWLWLMPALVFFLVFTYYPFIKTVVSSFFVVNKMGVFKQFAGFDNYVRVLKDRSFQTAIQNTFIYVLLASPVSILIALLLAFQIVTGSPPSGWGSFSTWRISRTDCEMLRLPAESRHMKRSPGFS